jgi:mannosyltransferase
MCPVNSNGSRSLHSYLVPGTILLLALGLRVYRLGEQSLWYDEAFGIHLVHLPLVEATQRMANTFNPPLYYCLLRFWIPIAGSSEFAVRMVSVYTGVLILPLGYSLAKYMFGRTAGWVAMLLFAISPLYVWHSQNARMYTLLAVTVLASIWALTRLLIVTPRPDQGRERSRWWWLWGLSLAVMIYAHTLGVYPATAQMLALLFFAWRQGRLREVFRRALRVGLALTAIYAPWLWLVAREYKTDFYPGTLSPLTVVTAAFKAIATGDVFLEPAASVATAAILVLLVMAVLTLTVFRERGTDSRTFRPPAYSLLLLFLTLVPLLIMGLALYRIPKFTPRYAIFASPTLILLLAAGLESWTRRRRRALAVTGLAILLGTFLAGTLLVFNAPRLRKDDFRSVARYIKDHIAADETVLLLSGHVFPVWDYYYSGEWTPVPHLQVIDLDRTVDYSVATILNSALENKQGAWVVRWQDQIIDPNGFVQMMLDQAGQLEPTPNDFYGVGIWHYRWDAPPHFRDRPDIAQPLEVTFGPIELLGYAQGPDTLTLFWQAKSKPDRDYKVALRLHDGQYVWGELDRWPSTHLYPTRFWKSGEVLFGRDMIPVSPGTPPGQYLVGVSLYDEQSLQAVYALDAAGQVLGVWVSLPVTLTQTWASQDVPPDLAHQLAAQLNDDITLLGYELDVSEVPAGGPLYLELYWQARRAPTTDYAVRIGWATVEGSTIAEIAYPLAAQHPPRDWRAGEFVRGLYALPSPPTSGSFDLYVRLLDESGSWASEYLSLQSVIVPSTP